MIGPARLVQLEAVRPHRSAWVGASAGTGKTTVLTDRLLALMVEGTKPERLLCLTFTKAGAAEMSNRLFARLSGWTTMAGPALAEALEELVGRPVEEAEIRRARGLFAQVLDAPGGLKIQTIHAFCQSLLGRFPLEAGIPPHFAVLDEASADALMAEARNAVLAEAEAGDPRLAQALATLAGLAQEEGFGKLLRQLASERGRLGRQLERAGGVEGLVRRIAERLEVAPDATVLAARRLAADLPPARRAALAQVAGQLAEGSKTDKEAGQAIAAFLASPDPASAFDLLCTAFLTREGARRARLCTAGCAKAFPDLPDALDAECNRLLGAVARIRAAATMEATRSLLILGAAILARYERAKLQRARLDYDDLILRTGALLAENGGCSWVMYKLDGGLDHILIDEAQDTNPEQWQVIAALAEDFFTGQPADRPRTIFVVGDAKQSIFSFQRADPATFDAMRAHFRELAQPPSGMGMDTWIEVALQFSFRSTRSVLAAVDGVFERPEAQQGVADWGAVRHEVSRIGAAGLVELWPPALPIELEPPGPWAPPVERIETDLPMTRLARLIARRIRTWLDAREELASQGRPIRPGDILILVRRRNPFVHEMVRALKQQDVPVAGVDRMMLAEQLPVMDLVALGRVALLPEDDLTLACLLKSPLVGLDEEELFALAHGRTGSLWASLGRATAPRLAAARRRLEGWLARADQVPPYEFFAAILAGDGGRRALLERLGEEAADPIDEFLARCLAYERDHPPSLEGFLHWLETGDLEVKRDGDVGERDEVRIMTVHGAKGLEAPIVFLPDTMQLPRPENRPLWDGERAGPIWSPRMAEDDAVATSLRQAIREAERREHRRLLYVAMTRAADRLYVTGYGGKQEAPAECWYNLVRSGLTGAEELQFDFAPLGFEGWSGAGLRLASAQEAPPAARPARIVPPPPPPGLAPWSRALAPVEPTPSRPLSPSRLGEGVSVSSPLGRDDGRAYKRGRLVHRLLQTLPELEEGERAAAALRFLSRPVHALDAEEIQAVAAETLAVMAEPAFAAIFGPGSRAEVPLVGRVGDIAVSGQVDRLLVTPAEVLVIDYKTNRPAPREAAAVPLPYLRQMAAYRALIRKVYPDRPARMALLWTEAPRLMALPDTQLDLAFDAP